jgi:hypothetical protein
MPNWFSRILRDSLLFVRSFDKAECSSLSKKIKVSDADRRDEDLRTDCSFTVGCGPTDNLFQFQEKNRWTFTRSLAG